MSDDLRNTGIRLGIRANAGQFSLLVGINALVGGMLGQERTVLPLLAEREFGLTGFSVTLTFIVAFGVVKAVTNMLAGAFADRWGRKPVLVAGWLVGLPVPLLIIWAPTWGWVVFANILLGVNQGLTWSTTVIMKIDLAGPRRRGLAMGLNEAAGYLAVSVVALATGFIAASSGLRPEPFYLGLAFAGLGLGLSSLFVRETARHVEVETLAAGSSPGKSSGASPGSGTEQLGFRDVFRITSWREPSLSAVSQAGLVNNLNDGMAWGLLPLVYASAGLSVAEIGWLAAIYPAVWGVGQLFTGAASDRTGRKPLIVGGMWIQAAAITAIALGSNFWQWAWAAAGLGLGTAMVYPVLLASVGDLAAPSWRASAVGVYRLWRDSGFAFGAILTGLIADASGAGSAILVVALLTAASGLVVLLRMREPLVRAAAARPYSPGA